MILHWRMMWFWFLAWLGRNRKGSPRRRLRTRGGRRLRKGRSASPTIRRGGGRLVPPFFFWQELIGRYVCERLQSLWRNKEGGLLSPVQHRLLLECGPSRSRTFS